MEIYNTDTHPLPNSKLAKAWILGNISPGEVMVPWVWNGKNWHNDYFDISDLAEWCLLPNQKYEYIFNITIAQSKMVVPDKNKLEQAQKKRDKENEVMSKVFDLYEEYRLAYNAAIQPLSTPYNELIKQINKTENIDFTICDEGDYYMPDSIKDDFDVVKPTKLPKISFAKWAKSNSYIIKIKLSDLT
jgi:hypothetical protein